jgi:glycosyltransferase involved in cell wall biosynthesis
MTAAPQAGSAPRILFLNNQGLASMGGGVTILRHLVADLARDSAVTVLSHDAPGPAPDGVRQITVPPPPPAGRLWRLAPLLRARHLRRAVPEPLLRQADLVIALDCHFAFLLRRWRPLRLIYLSLSCIPRQEFQAAGGRNGVLAFLQYVLIERRAARAADVVVVASATHAAELRRFERLGGGSIVVLPPVFPAPEPPQPGRRGTGGLTLLSAGRLDAVKNYRAVIDLAARLRDLPCRFVIAGEGPEARLLRDAASAAGVADRVSFPGVVADLAPLLAEADLFLHPSRYESFGIAVFEAMRAGVPPVGARGAVAGYREFAPDGIACCYVDFDRPDEAAAALRGLLADAPRRAAMGRAAQAAAARLAGRSYTAAFRDIATGLLARPAAA